MFKYLKNTIGISIFVITIILGVYIIDVLADNEVNLPGTASEFATGQQGWSLKDNIKLDNNQTATNFFPGVRTTHQLRGSNFGFAIPGSATIDGITFQVQKKEGGAGTTVDLSVRLVDEDGAVFGDDKADNSTPYPNNLTNVDYGGVADKWGVTLTPAIVNDSDFGAILSASLNNSQAKIDYFKITVNYTTGAGEAGIVTLSPAF